MRLLHVLCLGALLVASDARPTVTSDVAVRSPIDWWPWNDPKPKPKPKPAITDADLKDKKLVDPTIRAWITNKGRTTVVGRRCASTAKTCRDGSTNPQKLKKGEVEQILCKVKNDGQIWVKSVLGHYYPASKVAPVDDKTAQKQRGGVVDSRKNINKLGPCRVGLRYCPEGKRGGCELVAGQPGTCLDGSKFSAAKKGPGIDSAWLLGTEDNPADNPNYCVAYTLRVGKMCFGEAGEFKDKHNAPGTGITQLGIKTNLIQGFKCW